MATGLAAQDGMLGRLLGIAGLGSRMDFQLVEEGVLFEIKKTSKRLRDAELARQMIAYLSTTLKGSLEILCITGGP